MQAFVANGDNVLDEDHNVHMERVKQGNYVYMIDKSVGDYLIAESCDFAVAPEQFTTLPYSVALQKNSVYKDEVTQM